MRNTLQYPVTKDEVIAALERAAESELRSGRIGGIDPAALMMAKEFIAENGPDIFYEKFDPRSRQNV